MAHSSQTHPLTISARRIALLATTALALGPGVALADGWEPYARGSVGATEFGRENVDVDLNGSIFLPVWQNESQMVYVDIRGQARNDDATAEIGVAYREIVDGTFIVGVGGHYQLHNSQFQNTFERFVIESEVMTEEWDARLRGYIPFSGDDEDYVPSLSQLVNINATPRVLPGLEAPMYGLDGEIGRRLWSWDEGHQEIRAFVGGFYFSHPDYEQSLSGPQGRIEYRVYDPDWLTPGSRMEVMVEGRWDDVRDDDVRGLVTLQVPLQAIYGGDDEMGPPTGLSRRMLDIAPRDTMTTQTRVGGASESLEARFADGTPISKLIFVDEGGSGDMSGSSPENAANDADFNTFTGDPNTLIVMLSQNGTITSDISYTITGDGVFALGGGASATLSTPEFTFDYTAPGTRPTVQVLDPVNVHANQTSVLDITGNGVTVQGVSFTGGFNGVHAKNASDLVLRDIAFSDAQATINQAAIAFDQRGVADGIFIEGGSNILIDGYVYDGAANAVGGDREGDAIDVRGASGITIVNSTISNFERTGILIAESTSGITIANVTISNGDDDKTIGGNAGIYTTKASIGIGIFGSDTGTISNVTITGIGQGTGVFGDGIDIQDSMGITVQGFAISDIGRTGINIIGASSGIDILNGTISNVSINTTEEVVGGIAINGFGAATDITVSGVTISDAAKDGVRVKQASGVNFDGVTIVDVSGFNGFNIESSDMVSITNFTVDNVGLSGVNLFNSTNVSVTNGTITNFENAANMAEFGGVRITSGDDITLANLTIANQGANSSNGIVFNASGAGTTTISMTNIAISGVDFGLRFRGGGAVTYEFEPGSNATVTSNVQDTCLDTAPNITGDLSVNGAPVGAPPLCPP